MRPLELSLSGLHSYRDPVVVDFEDLGRYGLFGIFGRIGSGKSTLLDAITLALYGVVDRVATRARQGLVHLGCDRCEVRFRFAVDDAVYEVQRSYREVDGVAQRIASRVVRFGTDEPNTKVTLADKETEVNQTVAELIGLGAEDFTRAVVLPQGRFQQLLHLRGQDRRQMLQRIFHLQAYGDQIRRQLRDRKDSAGRSLASLTGELAGLGDASAEAITAAEAEASTARATRQQEEQALQELERAFRSAQEVRTRHLRRREAEQALAAHQAGQPAQDERLSRLQAAARIQPLLAPARRWVEASDRAGPAHDRALAAQRIAQQTAQALATEEAELRRRQHAHRTAEPARRERLARLDQLALDEVQLHEDRTRAATLAEEAQTAQQALGEREAALEDLRAEVARLHSERKKLRREHAAARVATAEREGLTAALAAADRVQRAREAAEAAQRAHDTAVRERTVAEQETTSAVAEVERLQAAVRDARARLAAAERDPALLDPAAREALAQRHAERTRRLAERRAALEWQARSESAVEAARARLATANDDHRRLEADLAAAAEILAGAERALAEAEAEVAASWRQATAADLARQLAAGEPCPVCGSTTHPEPARPGSESSASAAVEAHRNGRARARTRHDELLIRAARADAERSTAGRALEDAEAERTAARRAVEAVEPPASALVGEVPESDDGALVAHEQAAAAVHAAREALRTAEIAVERGSAPLAVARARLASAEAAVARAKAEHEGAEAEQGEAWVAFDRDRGEHTLLTLAAAQGALQSRDRRAETVFAQIEALETRLGTAEIDLAAANDAVSAARTALERTAERLQSITERITATHEQIRAAIGDGSAVALARAEREALATEEATLQAAANAIGEATKAAAEAARRSDAALAEARLAREEEDGAAEGLALVALQLVIPVPDRATVLGWLASTPDESVLAQLRAEAETWRETKLVLETRLAEVQGAELPLDDPAFAALTAEVQARTAATEQARASAIGASRRAEELANKAERYQTLQASVADLEREASNLDQLANVLRGDKFVEFVANDHLTDLTTRASEHLRALTEGRYTLALDAELSFVVGDHASGEPLTRPVHTLSGGETFIASLALALALSEQVQARTTRPLGFFFLDEGFGTLDPEALDRVLTAIERLRGPHRLIGLISHVPGVRDRVPRYLWVHPDEGTGSRVEVRSGAV